MSTDRWCPACHIRAVPAVAASSEALHVHACQACGWWVECAPSGVDGISNLERFEAEQRQALARQALALCRLLSTTPAGDISAHPDGARPGFFWIAVGVREPSETLSVHPAGRVFRQTCKHSRCGGGPDDVQERELPPEEAWAELDALHARLLTKAVDEEIRLGRARAARSEREAAEARVAFRLAQAQALYVPRLCPEEEG